MQSTLCNNNYLEFVETKSFDPWSTTESHTDVGSV
jgi:hypothetical protein